jgi:hypothetical protein
MDVRAHDRAGGRVLVSVSASGDWDAGRQTVKVRLYQRGGSTW